MKRVIVCCDGTWNDADNQSADTNVFRIASAIHATQHTCGVLQIVLYLRGVGTEGLRIERLVEGATGLGVNDNIRSAYNEAVQRSVVARYGKSASICTADKAGICDTETYEPRNLSPLFASDGTLIEGESVAD